MKITKIQQQIKRADRYSIYIDDKYSFSLSEYQLVSSGLRVGGELTDDQLATMVDESAFGKAYERTLGYVTLRPRSRKEITDYLKRTFLYPKPKIYQDKSGNRRLIKQVVDIPKVTKMIDRVLERLERKGYIDDEAFAKAWVRSRASHKKPSRRKLEQELYSKGIGQNIIATTLQNENYTDSDNIQALITKKRRLKRYQDDQKLLSYLLRQGFAYQDIQRYIRWDETAEQ